MTQAYPHLFAPIRLGKHEAKNRVMRVATTSNLAERNRVGDRLLEFYRTLAKGGVGTIVTEALRVSAQEAYGAGALVVHDRASIEGLRKLSDACHAEGALLIGQLNQGGRQHLSSRVIPHTVAPSAVACPRSGGVPHALSTREVREMVETFIMCAVHCIEAGMDGVEIHGAQGHLIQQFVSPFSNRRTDEYGGSFEKRLQFPREIIEGVRRRLGRSAIVGYRLGVEEFTEGGLTIEQTLEVAKHLTADGNLDYISLSQGNFNSIETHLPDRHWPILAYRSLQARFKEVVPDVPIVASTRIQGPEQAESVLAAGEADMIGMCRALLVDPEWPNKARRGRTDDIRRCIACNQCWGWISGGEPIACATNPVAGREYQWKKLVPAESPRHVVVVGGGPAGLEAARVAALRGHRVTLLEADAELGGRLKHVHQVPHHEEMRNLFNFLIPQVEKAGVTVKTDTRGTVDSILAEKPDEVILATGATPTAPDISGDGSVPVLTGDDSVVLAGRDGRNVVMMDEDGYYWSAAMAESLAASGKRVTIAARFFEVFREIPMVSRIATLREMDKQGAEMKPNMFPSRVSNGGVVLTHYLTGREEVIEDVAAIVWVGAAVANGSLADELRDAGVEKSRIKTVGDAYSPRRLPQALTEAHAAARAIGSPLLM
jgi:2,4-dienoyl-CoA reductase-like NADH-dependent reductase (Old Yellow Enzyme family)/pyruvate/2-oxoglutarate dehydrogenase complex dihydrolipoamide dehydrogenase (E3) component